MNHYWIDIPGAMFAYDEYADSEEGRADSIGSDMAISACLWEQRCTRLRGFRTGVRPQMGGYDEDND